VSLLRRRSTVPTQGFATSARTRRLRGHWDPYRVVRAPERVLHTETPSRRMLPGLWTKQYLLALLGVLLLAVAPPDQPGVTRLAWIVIGVALAQGVLKSLHWWHTRYIVTNARLLIATGLLRRKLQSIPLTRIGQVHFSQGILQRIFGGGNVSVMAAGQLHPIEVVGLENPDLFHRVLTTSIARSDGARTLGDDPSRKDETIEFDRDWGR
jgi:membrane protein YdbS with pleckstrin-like domain